MDLKETVNAVLHAEWPSVSVPVLRCSYLG